MILPFSTQMNGKPTYFPEKILRGIINEHSGKVTGIADYIYNSGEALNYQYVDDIFYKIEHQVRPKIHTIREDKNDRWKVGNKIDFFINARQKDMFRFAPVLPVVSVQKVEIIWGHCSGKKTVRVFIDEKSFACVIFEKELIVTGKMLQLAQNDGFDTIEDFFAYFNKDFTGKIIHWTDFRY